MRLLTWSLNVTLDGCCDHAEVIADDDLHSYAVELIDRSDGLLFGRVTYKLFESYWPTVPANPSAPQPEVDLARKLNAVPKYVVSTTLQTVPWENSFLISGDLSHGVDRLKEQDGKGLVMFGSPSLGTALANLGLIDEFQLLIQPILAGHGPTLLQPKLDRLELKLAQANPFRSGVVMLRYLPRCLARAGA